MADITGISDGNLRNQAPYEAAILNIYSDSGMPLVQTDHKYAQNRNHLVHTDKLDYLHIEGTNHFTLTDLVLQSPLFCKLIGKTIKQQGKMV